MGRIRYQVAVSLDGFIAGPNGEYDWIPHDPDIDFQELMARFDTLLMGRRTYEPMLAAGGFSSFAHMKTYVVTKTLNPADHPDVTIIEDRVFERVRSLRNESAKDIWLFGGGKLFRNLLDAKLVDTIEVAIVPVLLGSGIPMLPPPANLKRLRLTKHRVYERTGIMLLEYDIDNQ